jgi:hypothetical protein
VVRTVALLCTILTAWHIFATFLWISPPTQIRALIPGNLLTAYMIPFYGQSWSVFAPEPINGDLILKVRAEVVKNGKSTRTEWVDATAAELSMSHHNLFPPRAANLGTQQAMEYKTAYEALTPAQQKIVGLGYYKGRDWEKRLSAAITGSAATPAATTYLEKERHTLAYATQVARAVWGNDVVHVQFQASRQNVIPFAERNNPKAKKPAPQIVSTGWRATYEFADQDAGEFADVFRSALNGVTTK